MILGIFLRAILTDVHRTLFIIHDFFILSTINDYCFKILMLKYEIINFFN